LNVDHVRRRFMLTTHSERALVLALSMTLVPAATAGAGGPLEGNDRPQVELAQAASVPSVREPIRRADGALQRAIVQIRASHYGEAKASLGAVRRNGRRAHVIAMSLIGAPPTDPESDDLPGPPAVLGVLGLEHRIGMRVVELFDGMRRPGVVSVLRRTLWTTHRRRNVMLDRVIRLPAEGARVDYADGIADTLRVYTLEVNQVTTALQNYQLSPAGRVGLRRALHRVQATKVKVNRAFGGGE
jgi:hypothetical protein